MQLNDTQHNDNNNIDTQQNSCQHNNNICGTKSAYRVLALIFKFNLKIDLFITSCFTSL